MYDYSHKIIEPKFISLRHRLFVMLLNTAVDLHVFLSL